MKSFFASTVSDFLDAETEAIVGQLAKQVSLLHAGDEANQVRAWSKQVEILKRSLSRLGEETADWGILLELPLLRLGRRIDTIILAGDQIVCVEFKIGAASFRGADIEQAVDYALCLRDFHGASRGHDIIPILCADLAPADKCSDEIRLFEGVGDCLLVNADALTSALRRGGQRSTHLQVDWRAYDAASYNPTPDIVDAARSLYAGHSVHEIGRADANGDALQQTADRLKQIVEDARRRRKKVVCFVTGEPGAGKTLLGLELVLSGTAGRVSGEPAALLSGNRPLVFVLQKAIAEDARARLGIKAKEAERQAHQALQMLLGYLKDHAAPTSDPPEHVIVFDEAQRAWDAETGLKLLDRAKSEPELFLEILGRLPWACLVCLVGPGQEINRGESGLSLWGEALAKETEWTAYAAASALTNGSGLPGILDTVERSKLSIIEEPSLHLATSLRAYRNELYGSWVEALLDNQIDKAAAIASGMDAPPAVLTRDLPALKSWLKVRRRGDRRVGLLSSANAVRLVAEGVPPSPMSNELSDVANWFLKPAGDFRSSNALERPLSEFVCQGLEIDYAGLCWGGDLIWSEGSWTPRKMRAPKWQIVKKAEAKRHGVNAYRVLLTRARAGLAIYVPAGDETDPTRPPHEFDGIFAALERAGCRATD